MKKKRSVTGGEQLEFLDIDLSFVKAYRSFIRDGTLAEIGAYAFCVLLVIKMAANHYGEAKISLRKIGERVGITPPTVTDHIVILEEAGLLTVERHPGTRKCNIYKVSDRLGVYETENFERVGDVLVPHKPAYSHSAIQSDIAQLEKTGSLPERSPIQFIQIKTLNLHLGSGNNVVIDLEKTETGSVVLPANVDKTTFAEQIAQTILSIPEIEEKLP